MSTGQALAPVNKMIQVYRRMQTAIAECYAVDRIYGIAEQANAIAAYYKQIKDDESVKKFLIVKLRAWRRIGEILCKVDRSDCETMAAYDRKIKAAFPNDRGIQMLKPWEVSKAVKIGEVPADFFENEIHQAGSIDVIVNAYVQYARDQWAATPEGQAEAAQRLLERQEQEARTVAQEKEIAAQKKQKRADEVQDEKDLAALEEARAEAFREVGITLTRRDREAVKEVLLILREPIHAILRQAAFDHHLTMQAVLRNGLGMWLFAHGYSVPVSDMSIPRPIPPMPARPSRR